MLIAHEIERIASAVIFGSDSKASLESSINDMKDCAIRIDEEAIVCLYDSSSKVLAKVTYLQQSLDRDVRKREQSTRKAEANTAEAKDILNMHMKKGSETITEGQYVKIDQDKFLDVLNIYKEMLLASPKLERRTGRPRDEGESRYSHAITIPLMIYSEERRW